MIEYKNNLLAISIIIAMALLSVAYGFLLPLKPDAAYYWVWSHHLQLSYYDHPPLVAYLIHLFTYFSNSAWLIRLGAVTCIAGAAWFVYRLAAVLFDGRVAVIALIIFLLLPLIQVYWLLITPDSPLLLFWSATLYSFWRYLESQRKFWWCAATISAGLMLLAKYTAVLLFPALLIFLLTTSYRKYLCRWPLYLAAGVSALFLLPVVIWNAQHGWISFAFQWHHGMANHHASLWQRHLLHYWLGQILVVSPVFFVVLIFGLTRWRSSVPLLSERLAYLLWPLIVPWLFFMCASFLAKPEVNWPAPAYVSGSILLAYFFHQMKNRWIGGIGLAVAVLMMLILKLPWLFPDLPNRWVFLRNFMGYPELIAKVAVERRPGDALFASTYQVAAEAEFYLPDHPSVYIVTPTRPSFFTLHSRPFLKKIQKTGRLTIPGLYFGPVNHEFTLNHEFARVKALDPINYNSQYIHRKWYLDRLN